jgi:FK506-binding protein 1
MPPKKGKKDPNAKKNRAATPIQCMIRKFLAKVKIRRVARKTWIRVFDPAFKMYFFYNKNTGESIWHVPKFMEMYSEEDHMAATMIGKVIRGFNGRNRARSKVFEQYTRYFDFNVGKFYWIKHIDETTFWKATPWLEKQEVPMPLEDQMLHQSWLKIKDLEDQLKTKDKEIKQIRKSRYEELEPQVLKDRVTNAAAIVRDKHMDTWSIDELAAWFVELKIDHVVPFLYQNRVDGNLFLNLSDSDWPDMGIVSRFHTRKLQIIMRAFQSRYERKQARIMEDDDLISEYSASELSDKIAQEDVESDGDMSDQSSEFDEDALEGQNENVAVTIGDEERQQEALDHANIQIETIFDGDGRNFPMIGDICRIAFVLKLVDTDKVICSSKNAMGYRYIEFVCGLDQMVKGIDRAITKCSVGGRYRIYFTAEYGYGDEGLPPSVPPAAELKCELTLAGFRPRPIWNKPLLQEPGLSEKPYFTVGQAIVEDESDDD